MKNFALIGVGGYIAPRHLEAIKNTGNNLVASLDKNDSVGILDSFFPKSSFFTEFERFDRYLEKIRHKNGEKVDYVSICSPNYLHDAHCRFALRIGADAICEKPLVLNPWNVDALQELEREYGKKIYSILQLRLHSAITSLKSRIETDTPDKIYDIDLTYITSRGPWYEVSWKGDIKKSGGVTCNIGIHFFDMLLWIFGAAKTSIIHRYDTKGAAGYIELERARVRWYLSLDKNDLPHAAVEKGLPTYRSITIEGEELEFSGGFTELHTISYEGILSGKGFGLSDVRPSIELVSNMRTAPVEKGKGELHPYLEGRK
ncbi:UDP-N-acetyl-2-amino-2-deoxy-D-glucuronate oxidase [Limihaloglobus sulfuriphilus]|uniref:UDP-N-acetyl-2-amino-2-deoxy-D-glucuronate oxidase n=1 Tax=Limihaloglobus sulfuriphilus TaxID=1851148 RepID=A0A1Q2MFT4_9BACT|nr:Gfo/Idh/MocA family oxidoreductase [Limihaloglobus sulfuriphilus]AQQ71509.1 UDP-N-acetyl-2-amino-2-deoxy-D-glucuronate oxidase [Limihaloglobus sulfuriphilus]